jgi:hypothetical protein
LRLFLLTKLGLGTEGKVMATATTATITFGKSKGAMKKRRDTLRQEFWPEEIAWLGPEEKGYFCAPRTLPLILSALRSKKLTGNLDPSAVYLELLSRHWGEGIVEMVLEDDHAFAAGYVGSRATRTWRERMKVLEHLGFIKARKTGNRQYGVVLLVHPTLIVQRLHEKGQLPKNWWETYRGRQLENKEPSAQEIRDARMTDDAERSVAK